MKSLSDGLPVGIYLADERKVLVLLKFENVAVTDTYSLENSPVRNGEHSIPLFKVTREEGEFLISIQIHPLVSEKEFGVFKIRIGVNEFLFIFV